MENKSVFEKYLKEEEKILEEDIKTDILIIGGGLSGILTAFYLSDSNLKVTLVERNRIGSGITSKMTAKVTILQDLLTKISKKDLDLYLKSQIDGLKLLKKNIEAYSIECDFLKNDSYLFTTVKSNKKKLDKVLELLDRNKIKWTNGNLNLKEVEVISSIKIRESYVMNPVKYVNAIKKLCKGTSIYENTKVVEVKKEEDLFIVKTSNNKKIIAKQVVFATNYPYFLKPLFFPLKVKLEKSYISYGKTRLEYPSNFNAINIDKKVHSIRFYKSKMIYLTGSKWLASNSNDIKNFSLLKENPFILKKDNLWSNIDIVPGDYVPIIGRVFKDMYILTGYSAWGILSSHIGAYMISSMIKKKRKFLKYQALFDPRKKLSLKLLFQDSLNIYQSMKGYFKGFITRNKFVFYSKDKAIYVSGDGICYVVLRKCPHMKCYLIFNEVEKTWDCPCHGSRFDLSGKAISGPSKYDIHVN